MNQELLSIEEIDAHLSKHGVTSNAESLQGINLCQIFKTVRPILIFVKALIFFKPAWQVILQSLIDALDKTCP